MSLHKNKDCDNWCHMCRCKGCEHCSDEHLAVYDGGWVGWTMLCKECAEAVIEGYYKRYIENTP